MALSPNVVVVAPGDLITAAHLNNVRSNLDRLDTTKLSLTGGTLSGTVTVGATPEATTPTAGADVNVSGQIKSVAPASFTTSQTNLIVGRGGSPGGNTAAQYVRFDRGAAVIGTITIASATSVAYNTTSDPRSKTAPPLTRGIDDAAGRVQAIGRNAWQGHHVDPDSGDAEGGDLWDFVSSHDIETHAPYAVYGERDAVDETGAPAFQQVSYGDLVPLLFAALADALDRIEALEAAA